MMSITQFRPIKGFEELYEIDNDGNVKSHITNKILKKSLTTKGYYHVTLCKDGKQYNKNVHRLVAEAFLPNPLGLPCVNHKNEIKTDNHIELTLDSEGNVVVDYEKSNLEWCSYKYNNNWGSRNEKVAAKLRGKVISEETKRKLSETKKGKPNLKLRGRKHTEETKTILSEKLTNNQLISKPVVAVKDGKVVLEFPSIMEAERNGFNSGTISQCCNGKRRTHGGYQWYFKSDWEEIQKNAAPHKRETALQLEINFD